MMHNMLQKLGYDTVESSRPKPPSREDKMDIKTSKLSLQGCTQLENVFVRGLPNLVEIDLSGSAIKLLDLQTMVLYVPKLKRIFLLGCEHLRAIKWGPHVRTVLNLELVCIDTRPWKRARGFTRPSIAKHKSFSLQLHAVLADARLVRSFSRLVDRYIDYKKSTYLNVHLSSSTEHSGGVEFRAGAIEITEPSNQQHHVQASQYGDVFMEISNANFPMLDFSKPPTEQLDCHVEIGDGSRCLESELAYSRYHFTLQYLMSVITESVHVHDTSANMCTPAEYWYQLKWCRVERCPNLDTVFPSGAVDLQNQLQIIWASDLLNARCIWSKVSRDTSSFQSLQHLHLRSCLRIRFALPVWVASFPSLETLRIIHCGDVRHVFELDERYPEEIAEDGVPFPKLTTIHLYDLPKGSFVS